MACTTPVVLPFEKIKGNGVKKATNNSTSKNPTHSSQNFRKVLFLYEIIYIVLNPYLYVPSIFPF